MGTWIIVMIVMIILEAVSINLITIWFALGALAAAISTYFTSDTEVQLFVFFAISIATLVSLRQLVKKHLKPGNFKLNTDRVIGMTGIVTKDIFEHQYGEVKVDGKIWTAKADKEDLDIKVGTEVEILKIEGVKLIVRKKEEK